MKLTHFERLRPVCPLCLRERLGVFPVRVASTFEATDVEVLQALLHCTNPNCQREYPIIDGIPILVPNVREYVSSRIHQITAREELSNELEGLLTDCCGPGSAYELDRLYLSNYAWGHYQDKDKAERSVGSQNGSFVQLLDAMLVEDLVGADETFLDVGCSVGRGTFHMAENTKSLSLGIDLNFSMLRLAQRVVREGVVRYPRRAGGIVYQRREFSAEFEHKELVDFWACDALALPFAPGTFEGVSAINVIDCVASPVQLLNDLATVLKPGGCLLLTTPYDWTTSATPLECWIGGHSPRGPFRGSPEMLVRAILTPGAHPQSLPNVQLVKERSEIPWSVRLHERSVVNYVVHGLVVKVLEGPPNP